MWILIMFLAGAPAVQIAQDSGLACEFARKNAAAQGVTAICVEAPPQPQASING